MTVVVIDDKFEEVKGNLIPGSSLASIANVMKIFVERFQGL